MSSTLTVKEKELTKYKEDQKLLIKRLRNIQGKRTVTVPQVCYCYNNTSCYVHICIFNVTTGAIDRFSMNNNVYEFAH